MADYREGEQVSCHLLSEWTGSSKARLSLWGDKVGSALG